MAEILVVDDERTVREGLKRALTEEGFAVRTARSGDEALAKFRERRPDLVLLDVMMSKRNGFSVCEEIRREDAVVPVMFLTGLDGAMEEIKGMTVGADDYILKTAPKEVLFARIRRSLERSAVAPQDAAASMRVGRATIDFTMRMAVFDGGGSEKLTGCELDILRALATDRSRYFTNAEICTLMHGEGYCADAATLRSQISRLKAKLGPSGELLRGERYLGYRLMP